MKKIVLIYGGRSAEREVSVWSAFSVLKAMDYTQVEVQTVFISKEGDWVKGTLFTAPPKNEGELHLSYAISKEDDAPDYTGVIISPSEIYEKGAIAFPVLHGPMGEDGTIQGFFETIKMAYVGSGVLASANGMDKIMTKHLLQVAGIPQVPFVPVLRNEWKTSPKTIFDLCEGTLVYPLFVKPANMGSSVGISKVENRQELQKAFELAFEYDSRVIVEQGIDAREIEIGLLGNEEVKTTLPGEIVKEAAFYDYNEKYIDNKIQMAIPAEVESEIVVKAREYAKRAFQILDGSGLSRADFFLTKNGELFLNELNTMPGFTQFSMYPLLWENMGLSYSDLIKELITLGEKRFEVRQGYFKN
ncbi:D-alanine-D-alanine ligase [Pilibacter termitis]|uniref:D-alanine--D-alanine ligase n=1 Tax=Pilibacter termitis TaxID=263852 RepID=A0A1T4MZF8_9ENTE|nr:D-alanine--D-alanine ligase [Pilibacter termitis]SJZ72281.1 D-alanine-D-alanine ligase [Pilibacter termitis]